MDPEHERVCLVLSVVISHANDRFQVLEGKDLFAMQIEYLEWISGDWSQLDVDWFLAFDR